MPQILKMESEALGTILFEEWPEGLVLWVGGQIVWRSWEGTPQLLPGTKAREPFAIDLTKADGRFEIAGQLFHRFCEDLAHDSGKARVRLVSGIQIAIREARAKGWIEPLIYYRAGDEKQEG